MKKTDKKRTAKAKAETIDRKNKRANKYRFCYGGNYNKNIATA